PVGEASRRRWTDGPGDEECLGGRLFARLVRNSGARFVELGRLACQAVAPQPETAGPEGIGLDHIRTSGNVRAMDRADAVWVRDVQLGQRTVQGDAAGVEQGTHGTVADEHLRGQTSGDV